MAERGSFMASVRVRTTAAAVAVVAVALCLGAVALVLLVRDSLRDGVESTAEQQLTSLVHQVETSGLPQASTRTGGDDGDDLAEERDEDPEDPEDLVWQVLDDRGRVVAASQPLGRSLGRSLPPDEDEVRLPGADHAYLVVSDETRVGEAGGEAGEHEVVVVAASLEEVEESTDALLGPLAIGLPLLLLLVGATSWVVVTRALAPVERIRREVEQVSGERLDRRVPEPRSRDEIHLLAATMNRMLARLQDSHDRQRQFVGDASHELRSPLASIRQTAEVAQAHPGALPEGELAEAVLEESLRMQRLVEQMLVLTRADAAAGAIRSEVLDLADVVRDGARALRPDVTVDTTAVGPAAVSGNRTALGQVVRNLVDNAARHARSRVTITLRASGDTVELSVEDDGSGIATGDRERVFERFVRLDEARSRDAGGSGLGLAIVRDVVRAHRGTVQVYDSDLGGARFVVRLPAAAGTPS